jgi:hypothetical protein
MRGGAQEVKSHPWFNGVDWAAMLDPNTIGPLRPKDAPLGDTSNFYVDSGETFLSESPSFTGDQSIFADF